VAGSVQREGCGSFENSNIRKREMIQVELKNHGIRTPLEMASFGALICSQSEVPALGEVIDIENAVFKKRHHTTLQHSYFTFLITGVGVGDVTWGPHLTSVHYTTGQRSARLSTDMFASPDFTAIEQYIRHYYNLDRNLLMEVMQYVEYGLGLYQKHIGGAESIAERFLHEERPFAKGGSIGKLKGRVAQEQLRVFIPVIFPTALVHTVSLAALAALYAVAWSAPMRDLTELMVHEVVKKYPDLEFMFKRRKWPEGEPPTGTVVGVPLERGDVMYDPRMSVIRMDDIPQEDAIVISHDDMYPIDLLPFSPEFMDYNILELKTRNEMSVMTYGQKQRHRTVKRGHPVFTGDFYLPPILSEMGLEREARTMLRRWFSLLGRVPASLFYTLAPYGAVVRYEEVASFNAAIHELSDRGCYKAGPEVYELSRLLDGLTQGTVLGQYLRPPCVFSGRCGQGSQYCGRDMQKLKENPFPKRRV
jgi:hypothetical protein